MAWPMPEDDPVIDGDFAGEAIGMANSCRGGEVVWGRSDRVDAGCCSMPALDAGTAREVRFAAGAEEVGEEGARTPRRGGRRRLRRGG